MYATIQNFLTNYGKSVGIQSYTLYINVNLRHSNGLQQEKAMW